LTGRVAEQPLGSAFCGWRLAAADLKEQAAMASAAIRHWQKCQQAAAFGALSDNRIARINKRAVRVLHCKTSTEMRILCVAAE
jgi:hypothetical protein